MVRSSDEVPVQQNQLAGILAGVAAARNMCTRFQQTAVSVPKPHTTAGKRRHRSFPKCCGHTNQLGAKGRIPNACLTPQPKRLSQHGTSAMTASQPAPSISSHTRDDRHEETQPARHVRMTHGN